MPIFAAVSKAASGPVRPLKKPSAASSAVLRATLASETLRLAACNVVSVESSTILANSPLPNDGAPLPLIVIVAVVLPPSLWSAVKVTEVTAFISASRS